MEASREILQQGLVSLKINAIHAEDKIDRLMYFLELLDKWNKTYNLTAVNSSADRVRLHLLDSLSVLPYIHGKTAVDVGTGAGLPGIPLAIFLPDIDFTLLDANAKKTRFVQQAALELKLSNIRVEQNRVEYFKPESRYSTVITRAFAKLQDIQKLTSHLLADDGVILAMKARVADQELSRLSVDYGLIPLNIPGIAAERHLVRIKRQSYG